MREGLHVPQVSRAPQPRGEVLVEVQGRLISCEQLKTQENEMQRQTSSIASTRRLSSQPGGGKKIKCCLLNPSPQAARSCLQVSPRCVCLGSAGSREL